MSQRLVCCIHLNTMSAPQLVRVIDHITQFAKFTEKIKSDPIPQGQEENVKRKLDDLYAMACGSMLLFKTEYHSTSKTEIKGLISQINKNKFTQKEDDDKDDEDTDTLIDMATA